MAIQLVAFGGLHAVDDTGELERLFAQHSRAALFIYLVVERRVSRESLIALFWPESDAENARHALRQGLYQLRKAVGSEWIDSRAHELVVRDDVRSDALDFSHAIEQGDVESAVRLYQGPFLDGIHLVDLKPWESWVDSRRAQYARAFRKACRDLIDVKREAGDLAGALKAAEHWAARDPSDDEAQHRLIECLAAAGERAEAIRQYETYARTLEPDGVRPLDETQELVERLRAESVPLPTLRAATAAAQHAAPPAAAAPNVGLEPLRRPRRTLTLVSAAVVLLVLVTAVWGVRSRIARSRAPSSNAIAVLPFSVRGGESVKYLGEGIVNLLGTALDGAGTLRPVDTRATFAAVAQAGGNVPDAQHAERVATRLGAGKFVLGDVVEAGGTIHIEAAVYSVGAAQQSSKAVVSGAADSVFELVDRLAARLLSGLGDPAADRLLRTAALTTGSLPAFKAYLLGEEQMRAGQFERAAEDYSQAIALDSTFAVAHYRLALAREWAPLPGEEEAARAAARHGARLSARDRMLLDAFRLWRVGDATQAADAYRAILARYPDDVDAWFQLGEILFHHGPLVGHPLEESEEAWRKVLAFEPRNLFALTHLARIAAVAGRSATLDSLFAKFSPEELRSDRRLLELLILRAVARGDTAAARRLAQDVRRGEGFSVWRVAVFLTAFTPDPAMMRTVLQDLAKDYSNPGLRADLLWFGSVLDLTGGRIAAARVALTEAVNAERTETAQERRSGFEPVIEWFTATLPLPYADVTLLEARRRAASTHVLPEAKAPFVNELGIGGPIQLEPLRQYTLGILSSRLRDTASASAAATQLERLAALGTATTLTRDLDRGLRARLAWQRGRPQEALRLLETLETRDSQGDLNVIPFVARGNERFLRGDVLASLGRDAEALQWFASLGKGSISEIPLLAPSHFRQAQIHERLGHREQALGHYTRVVQLWRGADMEFRQFADSARRQAAKLTHPD